MEKILVFVLAASALGSVSSIRYRQYHFIYDPQNWTTAQAYCRQTYTDLVSVENSSVMSTLISTANVIQLGVNTDAWIGLFDDVDSWRWSYSNSSFYRGYEAAFRNWASTQPDNVGPGEACAEITSAGTWNDQNCGALRGSVCASVSGRGVSLIPVANGWTWTQAQSYCRTYYTDLASARDITESNSIASQVPAGGYYWFGFFRDLWKWSNGGQISYTNWAYGQPDGSTDTCVAAGFAESGLWRGRPCSEKKAFICYIDPIPFTRQEIKIRLLKTSSLDLNDAAVLRSLLVGAFERKRNLKKKLEDQGVKSKVNLSWTKQPNGRIFNKENGNYKN